MPDIGGDRKQVDWGVTSIALYLPQFYPTPENDDWWGPGFTEWTNVARARPLYPGHYQPHVPGELGFYDLRSPETRHDQAILAQEHGITAFCFWHYWFAGRRMLERPVDEWVRSGEPNFPFCLGWANETWGGRWVGAKRSVLIEQTYPGEDDHKRHFEAVLEAFQDPRYLKIGGRPFFLLYRPRQLPELDRFIDLWQELAQQAGLPEIYFVGQLEGFESTEGLQRLDAVHRWDLVPKRQFRRDHRSIRHGLYVRYLALAKQRGHLQILPYSAWADYHVVARPDEPTSIPAVVPGWDNTPRTGKAGIVYQGSTPERFGKQVEHALDLLQGRPREQRIVLVRSWNEWAEGNHMEPDRRYGRGHLEAFRSALMQTTCAPASAQHLPFSGDSRKPN